MTTGDDDADIKLVDFGFASKVEGFSLTNQCGTPAYVAPEIIRKHAHGTIFFIVSLSLFFYLQVTVGLQESRIFLFLLL
jgi:serine/threonine protein kinase